MPPCGERAQHRKKIGRGFVQIACFREIKHLRGMAERKMIGAEIKQRLAFRRASCVQPKRRTRSIMAAKLAGRHRTLLVFRSNDHGTDDGFNLFTGYSAWTEQSRRVAG